jgi:poly-beta-1,6-N-acetyl-D-glucosamine N-deacetylase
MHVSRTIIRKLVFCVLRATLLPYALRELVQRKRVTIIVYHSPTAETFDSHLKLLKRIYRIVPLSAYIEARRIGNLSVLPPKALVITIDDGHRSNYLLKGVLIKHDIPITIFICSGIIGTRRRFWFLHHNATGIGEQLKRLPDEERLATLRERGFDETKQFECRQALSMSELSELSSRAEFQSHTVFHPILPRCSYKKVEEEVTQSKLDLQATLGGEVYALAYPNGDYGEREMQLAEKAGYKCALTLDRGSNTEETPLFRLRRMCILDDADEHELVVKASGLWEELKIASARCRGWITRRQPFGQMSQ